MTDCRSRLLIVDDSARILHKDGSASAYGSNGAAAGGGNAITAIAAAAAPCGGSGEVARVISLRHPKRGGDCKYLLLGPNLCEIQRISQLTPASWFVDQKVHSGTPPAVEEAGTAILEARNIAVSRG